MAIKWSDGTLSVPGHPTDADEAEQGQFAIADSDGTLWVRVLGTWKRVVISPT